jgi:hypothetical protein
VGHTPGYSALDRLLHRVAFAAPAVQLAAAEMEERLCAGSLRGVRAERPVFVTALPRAGTTLLLEVLHGFPELGSQSYRDMPFIAAPLLWGRLSGRFHRNGALNERAHGDGMLVGLDSPEAFEEVLWKLHWPAHYGRSRIELWQPEELTAETIAFFQTHLRKVVALHRVDASGGAVAGGRYLSKNNGNIARLALLRRLFPDADMLVPFREPLAHAASLLRQHRNFLERHRSDPFAQRYMADLGHFEFGALHRPINFPRMVDLTAERDPLTIDYWLAYWIAAYEHILAEQARSGLTLLAYEAACAEPLSTLAALQRLLALSADSKLLRRAAERFNPPPAPRTGMEAADKQLMEQAEALHHALLRAGITTHDPAAARAAVQAAH